MENEDKLLARFQEDPEKAFPDVFRAYYATVCNQVYRILGNPSEVEDVAQDIFYELFQKKNQLTIRSSLGSYLKQMARTRTLNHIRNRKWKWKEDESVLENVRDRSVSVELKMDSVRLEEHLSGAIDNLPPKCRMIFGLKRFEGMGNKEIARQLDISVKTVENQMTTALKRLKSAYSQYRASE